MKNKLFLTSLVAMTVACPLSSVHAESFPSDSLMQENKTYESAATYSNMGAYDGDVTAVAEYADTLYQIAAGTYLPAASEGVTESCPANSYCAGQTDVKYNETIDQGLTSCPSGYPNSSTGASAQTQCYTACTVSAANIAHATAVSGNDYYGTGADTCAATACENGYHVLKDNFMIVDTTPLIPIDYAKSGDGYAYVDNYLQIQNKNLPDSGLTERFTWAVNFDSGTVYGRATYQNYDKTGAVAAFADVSSVRNGEMAVEEYKSKLTDIIGATKATYMANLVKGLIDGSKTDQDLTEARYILFPDEIDTNYNSGSSMNAYCYCQMTGYKPQGGELSSITDTPWVFNTTCSNHTACTLTCIKFCAETVYGSYGENNDIFRAALFGAKSFVEGGTCEANEISIKWTDATPDDIAANNAGMCTYGGDIRTPVKAATIPGKTFKGWKFSKVN